MLEQMKAALQEVQAELAQADIALMEATARQQGALDSATKLKAAVAALSGEKAPAEPAVPIATVVDERGEVIEQSNDARREMSHEEFEADRVARQRRKKRQQKLENDANNPLAHIKCPGCGREGSLQDQMTQAPSGAMVRMMVCTGCNNQIMH